MFCKICKFEYQTNQQLARHINYYHKDVSLQQYYNKFLRKEKQGKCLNCGKQTKFKSLGFGYFNCCSMKCRSIYYSRKIEVRNKTKETLLKKYGTENISNVESIKEKKKQTLIQNYGVDNPQKSLIIQNKTQNTNIERYGKPFICQVPFFSKKQKESERKTKEKLGISIPFKKLKLFEKYKREVLEETKKWKKEVFGQWDGKDFYNDEKLITNEEFKRKNPNKHINSNKLQPTIDHKISVKKGFLNQTDVLEIGNILNLCICSKSVNSSKGIKSAKIYIEKGLKNEKETYFN